MFSGIIEKLGQVRSAVLADGNLTLDLETGFGDLDLGESVAVNGTCLTVAGFGASGLAQFYVSPETLERTNLGTLRAGAAVNLERTVAMATRLSGHLVQGHVDGRARLLRYEADGQDHRLVVELPEAGQRLLVPKGSVTVNGMSLTVALLEADRFTIWITPHTHAVTTLSQARAGQEVNLEYDFLGKQVERLLALRGL